MSRITLDEVRSCVEDIRAQKDDDEVAHGMEDDLYHAVLESIADGAPDAPELAKAALETASIDFSRWCA